MDIWNYVQAIIISTIAGVLSAFLLNFLVRTQRKFKNTIENISSQSRIKKILKNYQLHKHLAQNPSQRNATLSSENFRMLCATIFFGLATTVLIYDVSTFYIKYNLYSNSLKTNQLDKKKLEKENTPPSQKPTKETTDLKNFLDHEHQNLMVLMYALTFSMMFGLLIFKGIIKRLSPSYYFKIFHEFTTCQLYDAFKRDAKPKKISKSETQDIRQIVTTCLEDEFPENELTNLGLAFFTKTYDYPKFVKKKMKKKNYNFNSDKEALITFTEKLLEEHRDEPTASPTA